MDEREREPPALAAGGAGTNGAEVPGVRCPACGCADLRVWSTRRRTDRVIRVRICRNCKRRVPTVERSF